MQSRAPILGTIVLFLLSTAYPAVSQSPQDPGKSPQTPQAPKTRPAPGNQARPPQNGGNRPAPGAGGNNRPPGPSNPGTQPGRPNPGTPPARPNPGGGNNRPQPGKPGGPQIQPVPNPGNRPQPGRPQPGRPQPGRPQPGKPTPQPGRPTHGRPPQWGNRPPNRPSYSFRPNDRSYLHRYYLGRLNAINRARRPHFVIGGFFPYGDIPYISPLPPDVYGYLPPPPPGYTMGYYQGYVVVYDPVTYFIANVIDLLL
jgi:hypothetical protein